MEPKYIKRYIREFLRILVPNGVLIFQLRGTRMKTKPALSHMGSIRWATSVIAENEMGASTLPTSMATVTRTDPNSAMAMPTEQMSTYFQVASREAAERWV